MTRFAILQRQHFKCHYCRFQWPSSRAAITRLVARGGPRAPTIDHRTPRSRCGPDTPENTVVCCQQCNSEKAHLTESEFLAVRHDRQQLLVARAMTLHLTQPEG